MLNKLRNVFSIPADKPELALAQYLAFRKQVPFMYLMLAVNTAALALTHVSTAPILLSVVIPGLLTAVAIIRLIGWVRSRGEDITAEMAIRKLRSTMIFGLVLGAVYPAWSFSLYGWGDVLADSHIAFFMAMTILGCAFCLMHLRAAAMSLVVMVIVPFSIFFLLTGVPVFMAIAINVLFVAAALLYLLNVYYTGFSQLIESRKELMLRQAETQKLLDENLRMANLDSLTNLANRRCFSTTLENQLAEARRTGRQLAVGIFDLDGFKPVNDAFGHGAGDKVLVEVGRRLSEAAGDDVMVARLGGDEFGIILNGASAEGDLISRVETIIAAIQKPYYLPEVSARVGASCGIVVLPDGGCSAAELFERADYALYHAKQTSRGGVVAFTNALAIEIADRSLVEQELKRADLEKEFSVVLQPLWSVEDSRTFGFEALARWISPTLGPVRPDVFIPVAERCGIIGRLTASLFSKALDLATALPPDVILSYNLSAKDVSSAETLDHILDMLETSGFDPARLIFELTETAILENTAESTRNIERMRALGIDIALDDFGVGQSSLGQVHRLPIGKIKIDRSFVDDVTTNPASRNIVRTILDLARNLDCSCIVEGVETAEQAAALQRLGCTQMQGYYFGRPLRLSAALERLDQERRIPVVKAS